MTVSVIIPTYNGAQKILTTLDSILKQQLLPDEIIVVIDGSTDNTAALIRNQQYSFPTLKIIEQENKGRAGVRNRGASEATSDLLLFFDDDMIVPEECVFYHVQHHAAFANSLACGRLDEVTKHTQLLTEFDVFEQWLNNRWNAGINKQDIGAVKMKVPYISATNFSILKNDFLKLGGFDERLRDAEDYDLAVAAVRMGYSIYMLNNAPALHNDTSGQNFISYIKRLRQYEQAQKDLIKIKPDIFGDPETNFRYPKQLHGLKAIFFQTLARRGFVNSILRGYWKWLPVKVRCKLYDFIVTANGVFYPNIDL